MNFFNIGPMELLLILVVVLIVFGPDKIPEIGASLGKSLRKFRQATKELADEFDLEELNPSTIADALEAHAIEEERKAAVATSDPAPAEEPPRPRFIVPPAEQPAGSPVIVSAELTEGREEPIKSSQSRPRPRFILPPAGQAASSGEESAEPADVEPVERYQPAAPVPSAPASRPDSPEDTH